MFTQYLGSLLDLTLKAGVARGITTGQTYMHQDFGPNGSLALMHYIRTGERIR